MDQPKIKAIINQANKLGIKNKYDIFQIFQKLNYRYLLVNTVEEYCTVRNNKILISSKADALTMRINLAHELGHIILQHDTTRSIQNENAANLFAFTILLNFLNNK